MPIQFRRPGRIALMSASAAALLVFQGCAAVGFLGALEENRRRSSTRQVEAEYTGLESQTFAVVIAADRSLEADHPGLVVRLTQGITERIAASGVGQAKPALEVLAYQYNTPTWSASTMGELAEALGVSRLVFIELHEYRLHDPGNQYLWDGVAAGIASVVEADSLLPDDFVFQAPVRVSFPDQTGMTPMDIPRAAMTTELSRRFMDRCAWLFYTHEEPYYPDY